MRNPRGFTLIEIVIAVFILMVLLSLAVPSLTGVLADKRLRRSMDEVNGFVHQAQERAIAEHRAYVISFGGTLELRPEFFKKGEEEQATAQLALRSGEGISVLLPSALVKNPPAEWIFWPSGTCEPAIVKFVGPNGTWTANYSPLGARGELIKYAAK